MAKHVVHRDIKPQNLFLTRDGSVKVLDFGIARLREGGSRVETTESGVMMGTPAFMPPEQALGRTDEVAAETDIWAVGATLFFMLSGAFVHEGKTGQEIVIKAATTPARSLATVAPRVPADVVAIVDRALAFEKSARWPSAGAMRDALEEAHVALYREPTSKDSLVALFDPNGKVTASIATADTIGASASAVPAVTTSPRRSRRIEARSQTRVPLVPSRRLETRRAPLHARSRAARCRRARRRQIRMRRCLLGCSRLAHRGQARSIARAAFGVRAERVSRVHLA